MRAPRALSVLLLGLALTACGTSAKQEVPRADKPAQVDPTALRVFHGDVKAPLIDTQNIITVGVEGPTEKHPGQMQVPPLDQPMLLGWYCPARPQPADKAVHPVPISTTKDTDCGAPTPGDVGPAVLAGHVNGDGQDGVFAKLGKVVKGDTIEVDRDDAYTAVFKVTSVEEPKKTDFPTVQVYGDTTGPELRLITCGGGDNELETLPDGTHSYVNQTIVYASLTQLKPKSAA